MSKLYTVEEAAEKLRIAEGTLRNWIYQNKIKAVKVGAATRLREEDIEAVIKPLNVKDSKEE